MRASFRASPSHEQKEVRRLAAFGPIDTRAKAKDLICSCHSQNSSGTREP